MNNIEKLQNLKEKALFRKRDIIFDNDGGDVAQLAESPTKEGVLNARTIPALEANIDTYMYTTGWGFGLALHNTSVGSVLKCKRDILKNNYVKELLDKGIDVLKITSEYIKSKDIEFFWGMRMNDTHDAGYLGVFMEDNEFKKQNPDLMMGENTLYGATTAVDYLSEKVRDFAIKYILDVVDNYNVDGLFLDFYRHPVFFRSNAQGKIATTEEIAAMSSFMKKLKEELDIRRLRDNKYYLVSIRVPDSIEYCNAIGIDIEKWLKNEYANILFTTSYLHLNNWKYSVDLGHKYNVPVYPSLDETRIKSVYPRHKRNSLECFYARSLEALDQGVDGILMFNNSGVRDLRIPIDQNWFSKDVGNFKTGLNELYKGVNNIDNLSKTYFVSYRGVGEVAGNALPHKEYINIPTLNHESPITISNDKINIPINIADSFINTPKAITTILVYGDPSTLQLFFNDKKIKFSYEVNSKADFNDEKIEYILKSELDISDIVEGENIFSFIAKSKITLLDLWVDLIY